MATKCRVLQSGICDITCGYNANTHKGIDLVGVNASGQHILEWIVAHSAGTVVELRTNCKGYEGNGSYGNYVKVKHDDGYYTLYAHMAYGTVKVSKGQRVSKGQVLGYMGATGYAKGGHLHWEVRNPSDIRINPTPYLNADLPNTNKKVNVYYKVKTKENGWLPEVKNLDDYAGQGKNTIIGFMVKVDKGSIWYQAHVKNVGWLPRVTGYDTRNFQNGWAGDDRPIDCVRIYYTTPPEVIKASGYKQAKYRINNLPWQIDDKKGKGLDGYAGNMGQNAYKLEITIE